MARPDENNNQQKPTTPVNHDSSYPRPAYAWYVAILMMFFYVLSFMDRQIIAVLIEPIKADLSLSDVQISLLGGLSFVMFYSTTGIFIGRLADSLNRPWLIAMGVFVWSLTTMVAGLAGKFWQLLLLRMGVGLGESALLPSTLSLLSDYFPPKRLATPTSVFMLGAPIGIGLSFALGGLIYSVAISLASTPDWQDVILIGGTAAWQLVLLFLGMLGMLMTLALVTVREPRKLSMVAGVRQARAGPRAAQAASLREITAYTKRNWKAIGFLYIGMSFISMAAYSQGFWDITFLSRTYDWDATTGSFWYGMVQLFSGLAGMLCGGLFADRLSKRGLRSASVLMVIIGCGLAVPFAFIYPLADSATAALWLMSVAIFGSSMAFASTATAIQRMFPPAMLGLAAGIYFFFSNAVGIGLGPTLVAVFSDYLFKDSNLVRYSLLIVGGIARVIAFIMILAGYKAYRSLAEEIEAERAAGNSPNRL